MNNFQCSCCLLFLLLEWSSLFLNVLSLHPIGANVRIDLYSFAPRRKGNQHSFQIIYYIHHGCAINKQIYVGTHTIFILVLFPQFQCNARETTCKNESEFHLASNTSADKRDGEVRGGAYVKYNFEVAFADSVEESWAGDALMPLSLTHTHTHALLTFKQIFHFFFPFILGGGWGWPTVFTREW